MSAPFLVDLSTPSAEQRALEEQRKKLRAALGNEIPTPPAWAWALYIVAAVGLGMLLLWSAR